MKKLMSILLALALLAASAAALAEAEGKLTFGYLAPRAAEGERAALCAEAFAYAARRKDVDTVLMAYDPEPDPGESPAPAAEEAEPAADAEEASGADAALRALDALLESELDGLVIAPESPEQALEMAKRAGEKGVPVVIEGVDMAPVLEPAADSEEAEALPYAAAVYCADAAAYAAALWLDRSADSPLALHCALPEADPAIRAGLERALARTSYLEIADEITANSDSPEGGREAVNRMFNAYTMFGCVLADSAALADGCAQELRARGESMPIAAIARDAGDLELLDGKKADMLAFAPASVEGVECFKALYGFVGGEALAVDEAGMLRPSAVTVTAANRSGWIAPDDCEAAYARAYPGEPLPEEGEEETVQE